jgi:hypothetical protein
MKLIRGNPDARRFVDPWCGEAFASRLDLSRHWSANPGCAANRNVNNPTQTKAHTVLGADGNPMLTLAKPGADTLRRVREKEEE